MITDLGNQQSLMRGQLSLLSFVRMTLDPLLTVLLLVVITLFHGGEFDGPELVLALIAFSLTFPGNLPLTPNAKGLVREILLSWGLIVLILLFFGYATKYLSAYDPRILQTWVIAVPIAQYAAHRIVPYFIQRVLQAEGFRRAVIVGVTEPGRKLAAEFASRELLGVKVIGFFDDRVGHRLGDIPDAGIKGGLADLAAYVKSNRVDAIYIALPMASQPRILKLLDELRDTTASIYFVPDIFLYDLIQARMDDVSGIPVVAVCESPFYGVNGLVKRLEDIVLSVVILLLISPLLIAIAIGVKLSSTGPVIFRQRRYGLDGEEIVVYKFRSMRVMEDDGYVPQARKEDPRVTPLGAFLRRTSLDELPQFLNVLQGRMSIVGPRPHAVAHNETYRKLIKGYMVRHKVKPGITGLAQVSGARGETDTLEKMEARIEFDLAYLRNWSLRLDLEIIARTALVVVRGDKNAY
jgi:putative colanic acid biosynthesis UDP-glucose lipid carrier transferase